MWFKKGINVSQGTLSKYVRMMCHIGCNYGILLTSSASDNDITIEFCGVPIEVTTSITRHQMKWKKWLGMWLHK